MNVYEIVTNKIIEKLQHGEIPWHKPWDANGDTINYVTRKPYSRLNTLLLTRTGEYLTFKQIQALGGKIKKGAKSEVVVFYSKYEKETNNDGTIADDTDRPRFVLRYYYVFHLSDTTGIPSKIDENAAKHDNFNILRCDEAVADYMTRSGVSLNENEANRSCFKLSDDTVYIPTMGQFHSSESYYATLFHELTHSTGVERRLNRNMSGKFGSASYAKEELVAEMGAAMLCSHFGIDTQATLDNSAAYIQNWIQALTNDPRLVVTAAGRAEKAVKLILNITDEQNTLPAAA